MKQTDKEAAEECPFCEAERVKDEDGEIHWKCGTWQAEVTDLRARVAELDSPEAQEDRRVGANVRRLLGQTLVMWITIGQSVTRKSARVTINDDCMSDFEADTIPDALEAAVKVLGEE
jgi:hypothetical protein